LNILGIDFEDWYHPELVKRNIKNEKHNPSVINGIDKILDLLRKHETFATFFVVVELLEIQPEIFDKIIENDQTPISTPKSSHLGPHVQECVLPWNDQYQSGRICSTNCQ